MDCWMAVASLTVDGAYYSGGLVVWTDICVWSVRLAAYDYFVHVLILHISEMGDVY